MSDLRNKDGRGFLLGYIDLLKSEIDTMQQQLERYAEDFKYLLAADDDTAVEQPVWRSLHGQYPVTPERISLISKLCHGIAAYAGRSQQYCTDLARAAHDVLTLRQGEKIATTPSMLSLEIALHATCGSACLVMSTALYAEQTPLSARIFLLAEFAAKLIAPQPDDEEYAKLIRSEFEAVIQSRFGKSLDPALIDALMQFVQHDNKQRRLA